MKPKDSLRRVVCIYIFLGSFLSSFGGATCGAAENGFESKTQRVDPVMRDIKGTVASMKSILRDPIKNLEQVRRACAIARKANARMVVLPGCMLSGHGAHPKLIQNAEPVSTGPLSRAVIQISKEHQHEGKGIQ